VHLAQPCLTVLERPPQLAFGLGRYKPTKEIAHF